MLGFKLAVCDAKAPPLAVIKPLLSSHSHGKGTLLALLVNRERFDPNIKDAGESKARFFFFFFSPEPGIGTVRGKGSMRPFTSCFVW